MKFLFYFLVLISNSSQNFTNILKEKNQFSNQWKQLIFLMFILQANLIYSKLEANEGSKTLQKKLSIVQKIKKFKNHGYTKANDSTPLLDINSSTRQLKAHQIRMVDQRRFTEAGKLLDIFKTKINKKIQVLKDFVQQRVLVNYNLQIDLRKSLNKKQREEDIRNIHFIKTFFDITNDYNQHIQQQQEELKDDAQYYKKLVPCQRKLKQFLVNYDNVQPIIKHQEKHFDKFDCLSLGMLKNQMNQYSQDYLLELEQQKQIQFKSALNQVRKLLEQQNIKFQSELSKSKNKSNQNYISQSPLIFKQQQDHLFQSNSKLPADCPLDVYVASPKHHLYYQYKSIRQLQDSISDPRKRKQCIITKKPYYLFTKQVEGNKNLKNSKGLITNFDVKLYDYIHNRNIYTMNKQVKEMTQKFHTLVESEKEQNLNKQLETHLNQLKNRKLKYRQHISLEAQKRIKTEKQADEISDDQSLQSIYEVNLDVLYDQTNQLTKKLKEKNDDHIQFIFRQCLKTNLQKLKKPQNSLNS